MKTALNSILFFLILTVTAHAAGEGTAVGVNPDAVAQINSQDRILTVGTDVSVGERIVTGASGQVQIVFADNTRLVVGPASSLVIETYLLASTNVAEKLTINALAGSFRFITGNSPKPAYSILTPTAAIAVRGTKFDIIVGTRGTGVMLYEGALQLCSPGADCVELVDRCDIGTAVKGAADLIVRADPEHSPLGMQFRYARFQTPLLGEFRVSGASRCVVPEPESAPVDTTPNGSEEPGRPVTGQPPTQVPTTPVPTPNPTRG